MQRGAIIMDEVVAEVIGLDQDLQGFTVEGHTSFTNEVVAEAIRLLLLDLQIVLTKSFQR